MKSLTREQLGGDKTGLNPHLPKRGRGGLAREGRALSIAPGTWGNSVPQGTQTPRSGCAPGRDSSEEGRGAQAAMVAGEGADPAGVWPPGPSVPLVGPVMCHLALEGAFMGKSCVLIITVWGQYSPLRMGRPFLIC